jgi:hypothetical protein
MDSIKLHPNHFRVLLVASIIFFAGSGWSNLADPACQALIAEKRTEGTLLVVPSVPHDWLFPRVSCIVHHCGVGTLAAALRSGVPQVPCPFMLDQVCKIMTIAVMNMKGNVFGFKLQ